MRPAVTLPTEDSAAGEYARQLASLLGTAFQAADGTAIAADLLALAGVLADARAHLRQLADEATIAGATDMLAEFEREYGLPVRADRTDADRQADLIAKVRAARAGTPQSIVAALAPITTVTVYENTPSNVPQSPDYWAADHTYPLLAGARRHVFRWSVRADAAVLAVDDKAAAMRRIVAQMKPAHTAVTFHSNDPANGFRFDDTASLFDRDVFG